MTINAALSNALSGLSAASRAVSLVSSNIANAMSDGYGRREIELAARADGAGGGVEVVSISRVMNQSVLTDRRAADGDAARSGTEAGFLATVAEEIGEPGTGYALSDLVAAADPELDARIHDLMDETSRRMAYMVAVAEGGYSYDQMIGQGADAGNAVVQSAIDGLIAQAGAFEEVVAALGLDVGGFEGSDSLDNPGAVFE